MVSFGPKALVGVCTVLSGWMPLPSCSTVTRKGAGGGGGGVWATGGGGGGGGGSSFLQPESTNRDRPNRAAFRSIGVPPVCFGEGTSVPAGSGLRNLQNLAGVDEVRVGADDVLVRLVEDAPFLGVAHQCFGNLAQAVTGADRVRPVDLL